MITLSSLLAARGNPTLPPPVAEGGGQCLPLLRPGKLAVQRVEQDKRLEKGGEIINDCNGHLHFSSSYSWDPHQALTPRLSDSIASVLIPEGA